MSFQLLPISAIQIDRDKRQRRELPNIPELMISIQNNGLINPITVTENETGIWLIAGERRLTACTELGLTEVQVQFLADLDPVQRHIIELEENIQRVDLPWQDHVTAVATYHELRKGAEPTWTLEDTAKELYISTPEVSRRLLVKRAIDEGVSEVLEAPKFSTAYNFASRREERKKTSAKRDLLSSIAAPATPVIYEGEDEDGEPLPAEPAPTRFADIEVADFVKWSENVLETPYNFLHVDFPYGVNAGSSKGQGAAGSFGGYEDTPEVYRNLCTAFISNLDRFCAPSAHLMFWFSMDYYQETLDMLRAAGWRIDPFPLIWFKSDNTGILPDANRGPRRVYETAFFGARGDRKIVRATGNAVGAGSPPKDDKIHTSQKSRPMLEHFFRMIVDESTRMLDPTSGSGEAVSVAEALGAEWSQGLEINPDYAFDARDRMGL